ncbi:hypothetical protein SCUCBS95973_003963 [Sporothrix curviconia]|uniref:SWI5-dependent HO expression protein 3 n=1 Tax=Sporothrix curviconia TaxID=1260050 RepID=A0ABP0BJQ7_9PEZI
MASYTTDRPASPSFPPFALKPFQSGLVDGDVPKTSYVYNRMTSDASNSGDNVATSPGPVLAPPGALPVTAATDSELLESSDLSPEVVARLEQIVNNFRNSSHHGANGSISGNGTSSAHRPLLRSLGLGGGSGGSSGDDISLSNEKRRHEDTKRLLAGTEARVELLMKELDERNENLEEFRVDVRDLKDQIETAGVENEGLRKQLAEALQIEQEMAIQSEAMRALKARLQMEMEGRRLLDSDLVASRLAHAKDLQSFEIERKTHTATAAVSAQQHDQIRELQQQLDAANKRVAARDRMLADAEAEKRALQATNFDARHTIEETAAVFGDAAMVFQSEVDRAMSALMSMKLGTAPHLMRATQAPQTPLPPTPPR